jgi:hypothetical protein
MKKETAGLTTHLLWDGKDGGVDTWLVNAVFN